MAVNVKFIVDHNVGKLARWLRMMGYDSLFFGAGDDAGNDGGMVAVALSGGRVIVTRDTQIMRRRVVTSGRLKVILIESDQPEQQIRQVVETLKLNVRFRPFTLCLECNQPLVERSRQQVQGRVPPYVYKTQSQYVECPACHRIYWRGTHWAAMTRKLERLVKG